MIITFIGCGFSANSILYHLNKLLGDVTKNNVQVIINIFESRHSFGDGVSYSINNEHVLLNRPAQYMSIDHHNLAHFKVYMEGKGFVVNEFQTRKSFGLYLNDTFNSSILSLENRNFKVNKYNNKVLNVKRNKQNKFEIITEIPQRFYSDIVILSTGNNYQHNIWDLNSPRYINNLYYEFQMLNNIPPSERVLIIGASLSAIDCALFLESNGHHGQIGFMSRSGIIPKTRLLDTNVELPLYKQLIESNSKISLLKLIKCFREQLKMLDKDSAWQNLLRDYNKLSPDTLSNEINKQIDVIQNILTSSNPYIEIIWEKLSNKDKMLFFNKFYTVYMSNRNPMPKVSAQRLLTLLQHNRLKVFSNEILSIETNDDGFRVKFADGGHQVFNWIINATGQAKNIEINELYNNLLTSGLIRKNIIGGIDVVKKNQCCISPDGKITHGLYAIGPKTLGTYLNVNSAEMLSVKAEVIAKQLLQRMGVLTNG